MSSSMEPPSVNLTRLAHDVQRSASTLLVNASRRRSAPDVLLAELRTYVIAHVRHHHVFEVRWLWPILTGGAPSVADGLVGLRAEHDRLESALRALGTVPAEGCRAALHAAAVALREELYCHLDHEDCLLLGPLGDHVDVRAWEAYRRELAASSPSESAYLTVGFYDQVGNEEETAAVFRGFPEPVRDRVPAMRERAGAALFALSRRD